MKANERISSTKQPRLTRKQEAAIAALLSQPTLKAASQTASVSETTLWRWLQDDSFRAAYMLARRESVKHAITRLQATTSDAVDTLTEIMKSSDAPYPARVTAARAVIDYALKATELEDLAERVDQLETLFEQQQEKSS